MASRPHAQLQRVPLRTPFPLKNRGRGCRRSRRRGRCRRRRGRWHHRLLKRALVRLRIARDRLQVTARVLVVRLLAGTDAGDLLALVTASGTHYHLG